jgi:hypothetical protein
MSWRQEITQPSGLVDWVEPECSSGMKARSQIWHQKKMKLPVLELIEISIWATCKEFKSRLENVLNASNLPEPNWVVSPMTYKMAIISCRIFEHFALQTDPVTEFIKLRSALCKEGAILVPKLADLLSFWTSCSTPSIFPGPSIPDRDPLIFCTI